MDASFTFAGLMSTAFLGGGTFTVSNNVTRLMIWGVGGGAGGGGGSTDNGGMGGGGGGSGSTPMISWLDVVPGETLTVTIGNGGNGGAPGSNLGIDGLPGGDTTVVRTSTGLTIFRAPGGLGGKAGSISGAGLGGVGSGPDFLGLYRTPGGAGSLHTVAATAGSASMCFPGGNGAGSAANGGSGGGGGSGFGGGGGGAVGASSSGGSAGITFPASGFGAGGGGGGGSNLGTATAGGNGKNGYLKFSWVGSGI
jgi:hypothetical protein